MTERSTHGWRKASYSSGSGACVEVAMFQDGAIGVRDSKHPQTNLVIPSSAWTSFLTHTKHGTFDL